MMHFEAAIATTVEAVLLGELFQEACADSPILDRRVVEEIDPDGRTGAVLGHRQEPRAEVARICTGVPFATERSQERCVWIVVALVQRISTSKQPWIST